MNSRSFLHSLGALLLISSAAWSAPVTVTVNSNGGSPYGDAFANLLPFGSVIRIGQFDLSVPANLALLQTSNDFFAVDSLFTPLAESMLNGGTVDQLGAPGQQIVVNDLLDPGHVLGQIIDIDDTYFLSGTPLYAWVFNSATPATATQWGIFSSTTNWGFPMSPGSETLATFEIDTVVRGSDTGTMLTLSPVPEPGSLVLLLLGGGLLAVRTRRPAAAQC